MSRDQGLDPEFAARRQLGRGLLEGRIGADLRAELELCRDYEQASERERNLKRRPLPIDVDHRDLSQTGWGVIFAQERYHEIRHRLERLLDYRREQTKGDFHGRGRGRGRGENLYREFVYEPPDSARTFLWLKHGSAPGTVDPSKMPYYLLLVGSPEQIPWDFQYQLSTGHAVGRLWFEDPADYGRYAEAVVEAETGGVSLPKTAKILSVENDAVTRVLRDYLVRPLKKRLPARVEGWEVGLWRQEQARKQALLGLLGRETPGLLLAACHGMRFSLDHKLQRAHQGALVCQDRPQDVESPEGRYFHAGDLAELRVDEKPLHGLIAFLFACYGAGTPLIDSFPYEKEDSQAGEVAELEALTSAPFVASLPQALLSRGALGVVGHVDRGWTQSFRWDYKGKAAEGVRSLEDALVRLLKEGHRLGHALRPVHVRSTELGTYLLESVESRHCRGWDVDEDALGFLWRAYNDARNFVVLGDPAVHGLGRWEGESSASDSGTEILSIGAQGSPIGEGAAIEPEDRDTATDNTEPIYLRGDLLRYAHGRATAEGLDVEGWVNRLVKTQMEVSVGAAASSLVTGIAPVAIYVDAPPVHSAVEQSMIERLQEVGLAQRVEAPELADLRAHLIGPRGHPSWQAPAPALGPLDEPGWTVTNERNELLAPFHPIGEADATEKTVEALLRRARHLAFRSLRPPATSPLNGRVTLKLKRRVEGVLIPAEPAWHGGQVIFEDGEEMALEVGNDFSKPVSVLLIDLGAGGGLDCIVPGLGLGYEENEVVPPGESSYFESRRFYLPKSFPFHQPGDSPAAGTETVLLFATTDPIDLGPLFDPKRRSTAWHQEIERSALGRVLAAVLLKVSLPDVEDLRDSSWTTAARSLLLRRSEPTERQNGPSGPDLAQ